jgi:hypothetical protein
MNAKLTASAAAPAPVAAKDTADSDAHATQPQRFVTVLISSGPSIAGTRWPRLRYPAPGEIEWVRAVFAYLGSRTLAFPSREGAYSGRPVAATWLDD